jgi:hypothetical protein
MFFKKLRRLVQFASEEQPRLTSHRLGGVDSKDSVFPNASPLSPGQALLKNRILAPVKVASILYSR